MFAIQRAAQSEGVNLTGLRVDPDPGLGVGDLLDAIVEKLGEAAIREKVRTGSPMMPGYEHTFLPAQLDELVAFLKTFTPRPQSAGAQE